MCGGEILVLNTGNKGKLIREINQKPATSTGVLSQAQIKGRGWLMYRFPDTRDARRKLVTLWNCATMSWKSLSSFCQFLLHFGWEFFFGMPNYQYWQPVSRYQAISNSQRKSRGRKNQELEVPDTSGYRNCPAETLAASSVSWVGYWGTTNELPWSTI